MPAMNRYKAHLIRINNCQLHHPIWCTNTSTTKYSRESHLLTVTGNQYTDLIITDATIFSLAATFTGLTIGDIPFALFRKQEICFIHFDDSLERYGRNLFQCGKNLMPPVNQSYMCYFIMQQLCTFS